MKLVMENKSGYIRSLCTLCTSSTHIGSHWDVGRPIENQLYLPNKEAVSKNPHEQRGENRRFEPSREKLDSHGLLVA